MPQLSEREVLSSLLKGGVVMRGMPDYSAKVQQYAYSSHKEDMAPRCIIAAVDEDDIKKVLAYASQRGLPVAVRTGGHQYSGASSTKGGILLDLEETFQQFIADDDGNVTMGISFRLGDMNARLAEHGLFVPHGQCVHVHAGGHAHTGGYGVPGRAFGLFGDHIVAIKVITVDGRNRWIERGTTNKDDADLFWAVLGGSPGNYAVLTHIRLKARRSTDYPHARGLQMILPYTNAAMRTLLQEKARMASTPDLPADFDMCVSVMGIGLPSLDMPPSAVDFDTFDDIAKQKDLDQGNAKPFWEKCGVEKSSFEKFEEQFEKAVKSDGKFLGFEKPGYIIVWAEWANLNGQPEDKQEVPPGPWFDSLKKVADGPAIVDDFCNKGMAFLTSQWIFQIKREFFWPYNKRTILSNRSDLDKSGWVDATLKQIEVALDAWDKGARLVVQMQHYGGTQSRFITNTQKHDSAYSWREDTTIVLTLDCFYVNLPLINGKSFADEWQSTNDKLFKGPGSSFADNVDRRVLWASYATNETEKSLDAAWRFYHEDEEKYKRLQRIKAQVDPKNVLTANAFAIHAPARA